MVAKERNEEYDFSDPLGADEINVEEGVSSQDKSENKSDSKKKSTKKVAKKKTKKSSKKVVSKSDSDDPSDKASEKSPTKVKDSQTSEKKEEEKGEDDQSDEEIDQMAKQPEVMAAVISNEAKSESESGASEEKGAQEKQPDPTEEPLPVQSKSSSVPIMLTVLAIVAVIVLILNFNVFTGSPDAPAGDIAEGTMSEVIATVNGAKITQEFIDKQYRSLSPSNQQVISKQIILNRTINEELLLQQAEKEGIKVSDRQVEDHVENLLAQNGITIENLEGQLAQSDLTIDDVYEIYKRQLTISEFLDKHVLNDIIVSDNEIEAVYIQNQEMFAAGEGEIAARHILLESEEEAEELLSELTKENFAEMAMEHSIGPSAPSGGDLGYFGQGVMVAEFEEAAFALDVGEISDVVETQFGFHIILRESGQKSLQQAAPEIERQLIRDKEAVNLELFMDKLRENADIEIIGEEFQKEIEFEESVEQQIVQEEESTPEPSQATETVAQDAVEESSAQEGSAPNEETTEAIPAPEQSADLRECIAEFNIQPSTVIVFYSSWCTSCQSSLDQAASLLSDVYFAAEDDNTGDVVEECFDAGTAVPQFICAGTGVSHKGIIRDAELKNFAASCN